MNQNESKWIGYLTSSKSKSEKKQGTTNAASSSSKILTCRVDSIEEKRSLGASAVGSWLALCSFFAFSIFCFAANGRMVMGLYELISEGEFIGFAAHQNALVTEIVLIARPLVFLTRLTLFTIVFFVIIWISLFSIFLLLQWPILLLLASFCDSSSENVFLWLHFYCSWYLVLSSSLIASFLFPLREEHTRMKESLMRKVKCKSRDKKEEKKVQATKEKWRHPVKQYKRYFWRDGSRASIWTLRAAKCLRKKSEPSPWRIQHSFFLSFCYFAVLYLKLSFSETEIGYIFSLTLLGDLAITLLLTTNADRPPLSRKNVLLISSLLKLFAGVAFAFLRNFYALVFAGVIGQYLHSPLIVLLHLLLSASPLFLSLFSPEAERKEGRKDT